MPQPFARIVLELCEPGFRLYEIGFERRPGLAKPLLQPRAAFFQQSLHFGDQCPQIRHEIFRSNVHRHDRSSVRQIGLKIGQPAVLKFPCGPGRNFAQEGIYRNETGMFSTDITIPRRYRHRRALYTCLTLAAVALSAGLAYAFPAIEVNDRWLQQAPWHQVALWVGSTICLFGALGAVLAHRWRTNVLGHDSLQSIRWLSPKEFNRLVEEGFRRQGYLVQSSERFSARAGIDIILRKGASHILVLCRRDPEPARQMAAVQELHAATATLQGGNGLLITCAIVAPEVKVFAARQGIAVIEGPALLKLVQRARGNIMHPAGRREPHFGIPLNALPVCASCGGPMVPASDHERAEGAGWYCARGGGCNSPRVA